MKRRFSNSIRLSVIILFGALLYIAAPAAAFFPLTWDDLMFQMEKRMSWKRAKMETVVQVFDPFTKNADGEISKNPVELPAKSFK
ncbi:MAG: hypothetical protein VYC92_06875, partial [SAR324 cluster bacterium]|nr:hypothetical protein [SAR324 cluster bacterium]